MRASPVVSAPVSALVLALMLGGCARENDGRFTEAEEPEPSATISTLSPLPTPEPAPATDTLIAQMRQSSIDVLQGQMQVWIDNDTGRDVTPTRIIYRDPRLPRPLVGENLRLDPAQSERGYPLALPKIPNCDAQRRPGRLTVAYAGRVNEVVVDDPTDVVGRFLAIRCQELRLAEVADVSWSDEVPADRPGEGGVGTLTLMIRPTGVPGRTLTIDTVAGSHLLSSADVPPVWEPGQSIASDGPVTEIGLALKPARCDDHAFIEGGGATAFRVRFTLDGEPGEVLLRMSPSGGGNAIAFALESCGLL
ncbi:MAG: hypothetical protein WKF79_07125 [Nocardioides sp.]